MLYEYQEFPCFVSKGDESRIVQSADEFAALGEGWKMPEQVPFTPVEQGPDYVAYPKWVNGVIVADFEAEAALLASQPDSERSVLIQIATEKGVTIDKRWSDAKIRSAIEAA